MRQSVLDQHGYVELVESWGSDETIVSSARMSTQKGFQGWGPHCQICKRPLGEGSNWITCPNEECEGADVEPGDEKLLRFLYEHAHSTPFEFAGLTIEVQAPIFVFREWMRHRVPFGYSEASSRYSPLPDMNYIPTVERLMMGNDGKNKQAGTIAGTAPLTEDGARLFQHMLQGSYDAAEALYQSALAAGVSKELARVHLPVGRYSKMRATGNLRGWLAFLTLRTAPAAQWEMRSYAEVVASMLRECFPRTMLLFDGSR